MAYIFPWRKAVTVSIFFHIFLLITAGYLAAGLTIPVPVDEKIIPEMELIDETGTTPDLSQSPLDEPAAKPSQPVTAVTPVAEAVPAVTTDDFSVIEADTAVPLTTASQNKDNRIAGDDTSAAAPSGGKMSGGGNARSGIASPGILAKVDPVYPAIARQTGQQGTVLLKIEILANGHPGRISIVRSTNYPLLDEAAVAAVRRWQFIPAKDLSSGQAIVCTITLPVSFLLNK